MQPSLCHTHRLLTLATSQRSCPKDLRAPAVPGAWTWVGKTCVQRQQREIRAKRGEAGCHAALGRVTGASITWTQPETEGRRQMGFRSVCLPLTVHGAGQARPIPRQTGVQVQADIWVPIFTLPLTAYLCARGPPASPSPHQSKQKGQPHWVIRRIQMKHR